MPEHHGSGRDALGRRRSPGQNRGLRPLHPPLPRGVRSRSVRVAMSEEAWGLLEEALEASLAPTTPRAVGEILERTLHRERAARTGEVVDWLDWQIRKESRLLAGETLDVAAS